MDPTPVFDGDVLETLFQLCEGQIRGEQVLTMRCILFIYNLEVLIMREIVNADKGW